VSSPAFEAFMVRVLTDAPAREQFLAAPEPTARAAGLTEQEISALVGIDRAGLLMTAESLRHKREAGQPAGSVARRGWRRWLAAVVRRTTIEPAFARTIAGELRRGKRRARRE
jgi:hypothetical protein